MKQIIKSRRLKSLKAPSCAVLALSIAMGVLAAPAQSSVQKPQPYSETLPQSVSKISMVPIPAGSVTIGKKTVQVKPFFMATTETTWEAFDVFLASGPPSPPYDQTEFAVDAVARPSKSYILPDLGWGHRGYPTINVSSTTADMFCRWLSKATGKKYRLPTEAEWELAARGGNPAKWVPDAATISKISWHKANSNETTHPVGKKDANAFGLFDILGNTGEWATDLDGEPILCGPAYNDPADSVTPTLRKRWAPEWQESDPQIPKSRWWLSDGSFVGFRVVCEG